MQNPSTVSVNLSFGLNARPALRLTAFPARSGLDPNSRAAVSPTGTINTSVTTPAMTLVLTWLKCDCPKPGARHPVLPAARNVKWREGWKRTAALPVKSERKSQQSSDRPATSARNFGGRLLSRAAAQPPVDRLQL